MTLHPQSQKVLEFLAEEDPVHTLDRAGIEVRRRQSRLLDAQKDREDVAAVEDVDADGVPCRLYRPAGEASSALVFLHGGGFVFGDLQTHDTTGRVLANRTGRAVLAVDYRRPPEESFPAAIDDSRTATEWLLAHADGLGLTGSVGVIGDSAGGNLACGVARRLGDRLDCCVAVYPFLDPWTAHPSYAATDGGLDQPDARWFWEQYADRSAWDDPDLAPLRATDLGDLPRTLVLIAEHDTLADEHRDFVALSPEKGDYFSERTYAGMIHGFWRQPEWFDAADEAMADIAGWLADPGR